MCADKLPGVRLQIAVRVPHEPEVWRFANENAVCEHLEGARQHELVGKDGAFVHHAVVVRILQHREVVNRLARVHRVCLRREAGHLEHPHAAVGIELDPDRVNHERLFRDELRVVTRRQDHRLQLLFGGQHGRLLGCLRDPRRPRFLRRTRPALPRPALSSSNGLEAVHDGKGARAEQRCDPDDREGAHQSLTGMSRAIMPGVDCERTCPGSCSVT